MEYFSCEWGEFIAKAINLYPVKFGGFYTEIDLGGPKWEGLDFAEEIKKVNPRVNIIFVTDFPER